MFRKKVRNRRTVKKCLICLTTIFLLLCLFIAAQAEADTLWNMDRSIQLTESDLPDQRLAGLIIGIDPGHQEHANSAQEPVSPGSKEKKSKVSSGTQGSKTHIREYVTVLEIGLKLRDALVAEGATVYMTRETNDVDISNIQRAQMMNELGADIVLRLHTDGQEGGHDRNGTAIYVRKTGTRADECKAAAQVMVDAMCAVTGAKNRGVHLSDSYSGLNWSEVPSLLIEMGYSTNYEEDEKLNSDWYQDLLVQGMVNGICEYFNR